MDWGLKGQPNNLKVPLVPALSEQVVTHTHPTITDGIQKLSKVQFPYHLWDDITYVPSTPRCHMSVQGAGPAVVSTDVRRQVAWSI